MILENRQANFVATKSLRRGGAAGSGTGANVLSGGRRQDTVYHPLQKQQYSILVDAMTEDQPWTTRRLRPHRYTKKRGAFTENADTRRTQTHGERTAVHRYMEYPQKRPDLVLAHRGFFQLFLTAIWSRTYVINSFVAVPRQAPGTRILRESPPRVASRVQRSSIVSAVIRIIHSIPAFLDHRTIIAASTRTAVKIQSQEQTKIRSRNGQEKGQNKKETETKTKTLQDTRLYITKYQKCR
ncbi:hypothetical protein JB92DRAFT_2832525 [Gautieria morchelliformis]|nr:hypothetical protein JB92DRAFT_2837497 [Gautieria morchelliformis]KAF8508054.1 hypothetical protein JB92DRAFT_2832525 [Gautieria morchelliformis]